LEKAGKNVFDLINGEEVVGLGSGKPDPGRRCFGRSQNLKGGDFRGRRGLFSCAHFWFRLRDENPGGIQGKGGAASFSYLRLVFSPCLSVVKIGFGFKAILII
jgi:hypothetical protein